MVTSSKSRSNLPAQVQFFGGAHRVGYACDV
jgi:hypothetical protein